jgi:hypothetical protein
VYEVVGAFGRCKAIEEASDGGPQRPNSARRFSTPRVLVLVLGKSLLDRIAVGPIKISFLRFSFAWVSHA